MNRKLVTAGIIMLLILGIASVRSAAAQDESPVISVINPFNETSNFFFPSNTTVGYKFNVTVTVSSGANVTSWEVRLDYNATVLNATGAFIPKSDTQDVFYGRPTFAPNATFTSGSVLMGEVTTPLVGVNFITPKKLAIVEFQVLVKPPPGAGNMVFSRLDINNPDTYLLDFKLAEIPCVKTNGYYELNNKEASAITLAANPASVQAGSNITLSGSTAPEQSGVTVTISSGESILTKVTTASDGSYYYNWTTTTAGMFVLTAAWDGDPVYNGAVSNSVPVEVKASPTPWLYYIIAITATVFIIVSIVYYSGIRSGRKTKRKLPKPRRTSVAKSLKIGTHMPGYRVHKNR